MTSYLDTLPYVLYGKIIPAVALVMARSEQYEDANTGWYHVSLSDTFVPEWTSEHEITYRRRGSRAAVVYKNVQMTNLADVHWGHPVTVSEGQAEEYAIRATVPKNQSIKTRLTHTWGSVTSLAEEASAGLKLASKTTLGYDPPLATGGFKGSEELTAEATASYDRKWGRTDNVQDTIDIELPVNGPFIGTVQARRSKTTLQVSCDVTPEFTGQVKIMDGDKELYSWDSFDDLIRVLQGNAPIDKDLAKAFTYDPLTNTGGGVDDYVLSHSLNSSRTPRIHWVNTFDNVSTVTITFEPDYEAMGDTQPAEQGGAVQGVTVIPLVVKRRKKRKRRKKKGRGSDA